MLRQKATAVIQSPPLLATYKYKTWKRQQATGSNSKGNDGDGKEKERAMTAIATAGERQGHRW